MISFIVIGRNEGWKLTKCFKSIFDTIKFNNLKDYEVIYVDSKSTDDSIERAKKFSEIKIFQITGICNAAIGRNIGAKESAGDALFFIDGDMEIIPECLPLVYEEKTSLKYNFVSGQFENNYYDINGNFLYKKNYLSLKRDTYQATTGGLFLIKKNIWQLVNGMKTKYKKSQDLDLGLRLSENGIKLLRKKELLAKHHTISYTDPSRMWKLLLSNAEFYRIVLFRDHFSNISFHRNFIRANYTSVIFLITVISFSYFNKIALVTPYLLLIFIRAIINTRKKIFRIPSRLIYFILRDLSIWFALFLFWPKKITDIKYQKIN